MGSNDEERLHCVKVAHEVMDDKPVSVASIALALARERATARAEAKPGELDGALTFWGNRLRHLADQASKRQWMNVLAVLNELSAAALREFNDVLKGRSPH